MGKNLPVPEMLSSWWKHAVILIMAVGFTVLIWVSVRSYRDAPPIPDKVVAANSRIIHKGEPR